MARRKKKREAPFTLEIAMLHLSGLDWIETFEYVSRRHGIGMTSSDIKVFAVAAEYSYELELSAQRVDLCLRGVPSASD